MRKAYWLVSLILITLALSLIESPPSVAAQATIPPSIFIQSPREGQALQGVEIIEGKIRGEGFQAGYIRFSYTEKGEGDRTWFYIADIQPEVQDSSQTSFRIEWDTTQLTDGNYDLRVVAEYAGGGAIFELIPNLRIRNYSPVESPTPSAGLERTPERTPSTPTVPPLPPSTPTPLPPNPAVVGERELSRVLTISGISVAGAFFLGMIYWYLKHRIG